MSRYVRKILKEGDYMLMIGSGNDMHHMVWNYSVK